MSSGYAQPNDAMHSSPTSPMQKKDLSQIVHIWNKNDAIKQLREEGHMLSPSWNEKFTH